MSAPEVASSHESADPDRPITLTARSVVATSLLGASGSAGLPVAQLVFAGSLFGIADTTIRTALSRMVAAGELEAEHGTYRLAGPMRERRQRVDESHLPEPHDWNGTWELQVVRPGRRPATARHALRAAATALRFAELREGVWTRPENLDPDRLPVARRTLAEQCVRLTDCIAPAQLVGDLFDLDRWAVTATRLVDDLTARFDHRDAVATDELARGFRLSIAATRHLQADPLLPVELLPPDWPGPALREAYRSYDQRFKSAFARSLAT